MLTPRRLPARLPAVVLLTLASTASAPAAEPVLVLQITVDQLRGDLPRRFGDRFGPDGFRRLLEHGVVFADAHHAHANTETIVGHTTLATGAHPSVHGMIGNVWYDGAENRQVYNIEDPAYRLLTAGADVDRATEIDPTQKVASTEGRSPAAILVSTFGDELLVHTAGRAKVFAVSIKDRGAVSMAGHGGKAFWFSKQRGEFVTSDYYYDAYPDWVAAFNARRPAQAWANRSWELLHDRSTYRFGDADDQPWETTFPGFGRVFPHPYGDADGKLFTTFLTLSPAGDTMTLDFAKAIIDHEDLGGDDVTDYLSVSFSSTDYVGHVFGPSSLEAEDNLRHLDRTIAALLRHVDERVGLDRTLVVLSADHGGPDAPGYLRERGIPSDYIEPETWKLEPGFRALEARFGVGRTLISEYAHPYLNLDRAVMHEHGLDAAEVEEAVVAELMRLPGVAAAVSSTALREGRVADTPLNRAILHNFNARRSGDVFVVFEPQRFINDFDGLKVASTHGSPWSYDTFVPVIFAGAGLDARVVHRRVHTVDVARTIAAFVGTKPPSGARGNVLVEVMD
ncbi:MAG: alkaline phosphatase family protein [Planctomycetota bacterium]|jgi:predicted AlkP superfamily pyrophosphatase or phosphodiesterase